MSFKTRQAYDVYVFLAPNAGTPPSGVWILDTGFWDDGGEWIDTEVWID